MKKNIFALALLLFLSGCGVTQKNVIFHAQNGDYVIRAEIADTETEWERGLMYRKKLEEKHGMLFIYPDEAVRSFWMKDTLIPLDMIFIDGTGKIMNIASNVQPCKTDPCEIYKSSTAAKYVVEIAAGESAKHGITADNFVEFK